jgi:hypothetical protein
MAAYRKQLLRLSSKHRFRCQPFAPDALFRPLVTSGLWAVRPERGYFGRTVGSPPGLPGGGITGVLPVSGVGARISGSTPDGGQITPSDLASLSPSGSPERPTVEPSGVAAPPVVLLGAIGAQFAERAGAGGAVCCCAGVAGSGGFCALAMPQDITKAHDAIIACLVHMQRKTIAACGCSVTESFFGSDRIRTKSARLLF